MSSRQREWKLRLVHILEAIHRIGTYTQGKTFEEFQAEPMTVDAVIWNFVIIGEAARSVPQQVQETYPHVPWAYMRAMRNNLAHQYEQVDLKTVWDTLQVDLPSLVPLLQAVLGAQGP